MFRKNRKNFEKNENCKFFAEFFHFSTGTFLIVAPRVFRTGLPYAVSANYFKGTEPITLKVQLQDDKNAPVAQKSADLAKPGGSAGTFHDFFMKIRFFPNFFRSWGASSPRAPL